MNTRCRPLLFACAAAAVLTLAACSKQKPAAAAEKAPPPPPEPTSVVMTTGKIGLDDLPDISFESVEIIVLDKLTPELIMLLNQQHKCYTALIAPPPEPEPEQAAAPESEPASSDGLELLSDRDRERLNDMLTELKGELPARVTSGFTVNGAQRDFVSRESLYNRYAQPISTLTLENMVPVLQQMGQNMRADYDLLVKESESGSGDRALQAKADINWMAALSEYMPGYERLLRRYDSLRRRALLRDARSGGSSSASTASSGESAEQAFERFQLDNAMNLQVVCYKDAIGTTFAQADGTFEVKGQGILLARIDDEHNRAVFFRDGMKAPTVVFSEVKTIEKTVQPE